MALVGNLKDLKLANIIQINCIERNVARVSVKNKTANGAIFFNAGAMVHAQFGAHIGERAVHEMLRLGDGEFRVELGVQAPRQTIKKPWNYVVLEGLRQLDEQRMNAPVPPELFATLCALKQVKNAFVLNSRGEVVEGQCPENIHPAVFTFFWYKMKKMLRIVEAKKFQYFCLRKTDGFYFFFALRPHLIVLETGAQVVREDFARTVKKILNQVKTPN